MCYADKRFINDVGKWDLPQVGPRASNNCIKASFIDYCYLLFLFYREKIGLRAYLSAYNKYF